ncbi:MAG: sulfite exporter TauE/SafE family protein [Acidobacteria bacterium]|nr:sulfite exporter TauE/SafE family protein [Acidobacteriota bacterium]
MPALHAVAVFAAAFLAGMINSIAGGGTLVSFPTLIWAGLPPIVANATNTAAIWPGTLGGMWGYRLELRTVPRRYLALLAPSLTGGIAGAVLLRMTPASAFSAMVPYLILFATVLFVAQETIQRWLGLHHGNDQGSGRWLAGAMAFQFLVGIYGGYFGAGIGILMLAALSLLGMSDIHQMNGLKNVLGGSINGIAALYFIYSGMVYWPDVLVMAVAAILGGWASARIARRLGRLFVRRTVAVIGFGMAISLFFKG